jgi:hypothetical protein
MFIPVVFSFNGEASLLTILSQCLWWLNQSNLAQKNECVSAVVFESAAVADQIAEFHAQIISFLS